MAIIMSLAVSLDNMVLAIASVVIAIMFMWVMRSKTKRVVDEREVMVRQKAAQMAYAIFAPTIGLGSVILMMVGKDEFYFVEAMGIVLSYLSLFLIGLYSIALIFFNRKYGGDGKE